MNTGSEFTDNETNEWLNQDDSNFSAAQKQQLFEIMGESIDRLTDSEDEGRNARPTQVA